MKTSFLRGISQPSPRSNHSLQSRGGYLSIPIIAFLIVLMLDLPFSGLVQAQVTNQTAQDRTVVTLDVPTTYCTSVIDDFSMGELGNKHRGHDLDLHDQDDASAFTSGDTYDGFDQSGLDYNPDYSDSAFSRMSRAAYLYSSDKNITTDDPDAGIGMWWGNPAEVDGVETDGSGYVDLHEFDPISHSYGATFAEGIWCDNVGYDVWIADTFNLDPGAFSGADLVKYNVHDIALTGTGSASGTGAANLNQREGLFRIAYNSQRDITDGHIVPGAETATIKHEYIMDLPAESCGTDDWTGNCPSASLNMASSDGLRFWPYENLDLTYTSPSSAEFGTVGFTLLCSAEGITATGATATYGYGRINPFTRGMNDIASGTGGAFYAEVDDGTPLDTDCDKWGDVTLGFIGDDWLPNTEDDLVRNQYAAIPSLEDNGAYDGVAGTDPSTYGALLGPDNWVGFSGPIDPSYVPIVPANPISDPWYTGTGSYNIYEVRASLPHNQVAGTYAGTIILACLPSMTDGSADFNGDGIGDDPDPINFLTAISSGDESTTTVNIPLSLSMVQTVPVTIDYTITGGTATNGVDYNVPNMGTITFNPGETLIYIPEIMVIDDNDVEGDETIEITLSNPQPPFILIGTITIHTYTIIDNDFGGMSVGTEITCLGGYNWARGFNFSQNCDVPAGGSHILTFTTDIFCDVDNTTVTLLSADHSVLYSDSCSGGLENNTTYTVGPFTEDTTGAATLVLSDGYGDGGIRNILWIYQY